MTRKAAQCSFYLCSLSTLWHQPQATIAFSVFQQIAVHKHLSYSVCVVLLFGHIAPSFYLSPWQQMGPDKSPLTSFQPLKRNVWLFSIFCFQRMQQPAMISTTMTPTPSPDTTPPMRTSKSLLTYLFKRGLIWHKFRDFIMSCIGFKFVKLHMILIYIFCNSNFPNYMTCCTGFVLFSKLWGCIKSQRNPRRNICLKHGSTI